MKNLFASLIATAIAFIVVIIFTIHNLKARNKLKLLAEEQKRQKPKKSKKPLPEVDIYANDIDRKTYGIFCGLTLAFATNSIMNALLLLL